MKKFISKVLAFAIVSTIFVGCAASTEQSSSTSQTNEKSTNEKPVKNEKPSNDVSKDK